ncbi:hypothetical protein ACFWIN_03105 [Streptomyces sp. NPDC127049]|uniref:hypothetical protein n=1 Tax=Streptomyces sp. NPDC127049 TaxID=3347118 RepID=UPI0036573E5F
MCAREAELQAALDEASSPEWARRARAGRDLAAFADVPEAAEVLARLLMDADDTAVTRWTAEALAGVGTVDAVRLVARAIAEADCLRADWLETGVHDMLVASDGGAAVAAACESLARDPEEAVRRGAGLIAGWTGAVGR